MKIDIELKKKEIENAFENSGEESITIQIEAHNFLDVIGNYEDLEFKSLNSYLDLNDKMQLEHRCRSLIKELENAKGIVKNALERIELNIDEHKIKGLRLITEQGENIDEKENIISKNSA